MLQASWHFGMGEDFTPIRRVREEVFVQEQGYPLSQEFDAGDDYAWHVLVRYQGEPVATGRVYLKEGQFTLGRICVVKKLRRQHIGDMVVRLLLDRALTAGARGISLSAQAYAVGFYQTFGFTPVGESYLPEGDIIPHIDMYVSRENVLFPRNCDACALNQNQNNTTPAE